MTFDQSTKSTFEFKRFSVRQDRSPMKVGFDGILLGAWCPIGKASSKALDIGTGTGLLALMLAQRDEKILINAIDIDEGSCIEASLNFAASQWSDRLRVQQISVQELADKEENKYDIIICNPPFFSGGTLSNNPNRTNVRHTTKLPHQDLLNCSRKLLSKKGTLSLVLPLIEGLRFIEMAIQYRFYLYSKVEVKDGKEMKTGRLLLQLGLDPSMNIHQAQLVVRESGVFTETYLKLVKEFYVNIKSLQ